MIADCHPVDHTIAFCFILQKAIECFGNLYNFGENINETSHSFHIPASVSHAHKQITICNRKKRNGIIVCPLKFVLYVRGTDSDECHSKTNSNLLIKHKWIEYQMLLSVYSVYSVMRINTFERCYCFVFFWVNEMTEELSKARGW